MVAFDDGYFKPRTKGKTLFVGVIYRLDHRIEGLISTPIQIDGLDVTRKLIKLVKECKFKPQLKYIMLSGVNFAGFNVVDLEKVFKELRIPLIIVFRKKFRLEKIKRALSRLPNREKRLKLLLKAGKVFKYQKAYFQCYGLEEKEAKTIIRKTLLHANLPEPIRLSHLIASGVTAGESTTTQ